MLFLDKGGFVSYCGSANTVVQYLTDLPTITASFTPSHYDNPADFVIDDLDLDPEKKELQSLEDENSRGVVHGVLQGKCIYFKIHVYISNPRFSTNDQ